MQAMPTSRGSVPVGWLLALSEIFSTFASALRSSASQWAFSASPIDQDRGLELHVALLQTIDDGFELLERLLEAHNLDVGVF